CYSSDIIFIALLLLLVPLPLSSTLFPYTTLFRSVGYPIDVKKVYLEEDGVFEGLSEGKIIIDMTTSTPALAEELAEEAEKIGVRSEEHTSELQSRFDLVCRLLLE